MDSLVSALSSPARIPLHLGGLLVGDPRAELANRQLCVSPATLLHGRADPGATPPAHPLLPRRGPALWVEVPPRRPARASVPGARPGPWGEVCPHSAPFGLPGPSGTPFRLALC